MEYREKLQQLGITLTHSGKQRCPQCSDKRKNKQEPCLSVTYGNDAVLYKCHNCDWSGAVFYRDKSRKIYRKPEQPQTREDITPIYKYFKKRGISQDTVDKYKISYNDLGEIVFPYYKNGELVNVKYRKNLGGGKKTFRQEKDTEKTLFGMDLVTDLNTLVWVEGEMDVLALAECGIESVSIPQGASENRLECIENCYDFIQQFNTYIIAVDNDNAGDKLKLTLLNRLGKEKCKVVNWRQYKDANEALMDGADLKEYIDAAEVITPDGILSFVDSFDEIYSYNHEKDINFFSTGWQKLDKIVRLRTGYMMIISGYPSRGKSTFVDNLLINLSKQYGLKHLIASFENVAATHFNTLLEMYLEQPLYKIMGEDGAELCRNGQPFSFLSEHFYRFDISKLWTIDEICERTELAVKKYGIKTLVIDPYNRLNNNYKDREDKYIGSILSKLSMLAKRLDILIIFVAHPKKPDGEKTPNMYSISGSGDWYNMADYGIIIHRDRLQNGKLSNTPKIFVEKVKNFFLGEPSGGEILLHYNSYKRILENDF